VNVSKESVRSTVRPFSLLVLRNALVGFETISSFTRLARLRSSRTLFEQSLAQIGLMLPAEAKH
jgi:hypothetical protein